MVVVTNACGSAAIRRTRCARRSGSSSENTSSSRSSGGRPSSAVSRSSSASLKREDRGPLLTARRERGERRGRPARTQVVAVRPDQRGAVPDLLLGGLGEAAGEGVARRLAGQLRGVRRVAQAQAPRGGLVGRDLGVGGGERPRQRVEQPLPLGATTRGPGLEERRVPEPQLVARRLLLADQPQQAVALLERPAVGGEVARVGRRALAREPVERLPAQRRRARRPGASPPARTGRSAARRRARRPGARRRSRGSACGRRRSRSGRGRARRVVAVRASCRARRRGPRPGPAPGPSRRLAVRRPVRRIGPSTAGELRAPADELALRRCAVRGAPREQHDRLEEAGLAGRVGPQTSCGPGGAPRRAP